MINFFAQTPADPEEQSRDLVVMDQEESIGDEVSRTLGVLLPWSTSIMFHLAILLLVFFLGMVILQSPEEEKRKSVSTPTNDPVPVELEVADLSHTVSRSMPSPPPTPSKPVPDGEIFIDPARFPAPTFGHTPDSPFDGRGLEGTGNVFVQPSGEKPMRVAYVIDASGSLIDTFPFVLDELCRSIRSLERKQQVAIIFYGDDKVTEVPPAGLTRATTQAKARMIDWINGPTSNVVPRGSGNPVAAIQRALQYKPELVYLLSDNITGRGPYAINQAALLKEIKRSNIHGAKINTIQFIYEDRMAMAVDSSGQMLGAQARTLYKISEQTKGVHRFVRAADLGIR